jgi:hypothetical protein
MHAPMLCFKNALAYFATAISYEHKIFMKLTPELRSRTRRRLDPRSPELHKLEQGLGQ